MIRVLFTGKTGLVGKNVLPLLNKKYYILAPTRKELDLLDETAVEEYVKKGNFDIIIHSANPNPVKNQMDTNEKFVEDSLRCFFNLKHASKHCKRLYVLGSGAEMDKSKNMMAVNESEFDRSIPKDGYGFAKYIINHFANRDSNIYNLRLFACYGPEDHPSKFISHCIRCVLRDEDITIRQNCYFDYIHVNDLASILCYFIENEPLYHDYNIASGERITLEDIAKKILKVMNSKKKIKILKEGFNYEYTPDILRLKNELNNFNFTSLEDGIKTIIPYEEEIFENEKKSC